ncbi:hypothetical protein SME22J_13330 [Serratia marcescens]|nr:hypothetical protein SME22J_13330 [Serratia marcescens]
MNTPTLAEKKDEYDALYRLFRMTVEMQLGLCMDSVRAKAQWRKILANTDTSVLADVLAECLYEAGHKITTSKS